MLTSDSKFKENLKPLPPPLPPPSVLMGDPEAEPLFGTKARLSNGQEIVLADPRSTRAMVALMDMAAVIGGAASHYGGPAAFAEMMAALHGLVFYKSKMLGKKWSDSFHIINDAGHCENGLYALKANYNQASLNLESLMKFRSLESPLTGHGESHVFPEGVLLSNGPLGSCLPQAQGLAMADALTGVNRVTVTAISDGACMEGEAKEALAAIAGLSSKGQIAPFVLLISDNNTKLSGRIDEQSYPMGPTFESLKTLGWEVICVDEGQNLQNCVTVLESALEQAQNCAANITHEDSQSITKNKPNRLSLTNGKSTKPIAIHFKTVKGWGTKKTVDSSSGGHGFPLKKANELKAFIQEIYEGDKVPEDFLFWCEQLEKKQIQKQQAQEPEKDSSQRQQQEQPENEKVQVGVSKALIKMRQKGLPLVSVTSDLAGSTGVASFRKEFPVGAFDVGVAESNMISAAVGISKMGYIPVVDTFSQFGVTKGALPFLMGALSGGPMIGIFSHAGFQDAADGASHQALTYFAMTHAIPHTQTYCLTSSDEAEALVGQAVERFYEDRLQGRTPDSFLFFLGRENFPKNYGDNITYQLGKAQILWDKSARDKSAEHKSGGQKSEAILSPCATLVAAGPLVIQALKAAKRLEQEGIGVIVVNPSSINHPDTKTISQCLQKTQGRLITIEDHQKKGGMGAALFHALVEEGCSFHGKSMGVEGVFGRSAYTAEELYVKNELDANSIVRTTKRLLE